ncbi:twin-arginine translocation signal domain-containing protein, partial [Eggerthella sinensis]
MGASSVSRRDFLRNAGLAAAGAAVGASALGLTGCADQ